MAAGFHEVQYDDGDKYSGEWNAEGKREGDGVLTFSDGARFVGQFVAGMCEGKGVLTFPDNSKYEGDFRNGKYDGSGIYSRGDGMKFEGQFKAGQVQGLGLLTFSDGEHGRPRQEGEWAGAQLTKRCSAAEAVRQAQESASQARVRAKK
eukprot:m.13894 g.13894  ORF g.13894 m.13894 type:complete len:149 (+) comp10236_c0_seq1:147-593(+)